MGADGWIQILDADKLSEENIEFMLTTHPDNARKQTIFDHNVIVLYNDTNQQFPYEYPPKKEDNDIVNEHGHPTWWFHKENCDKRHKFIMEKACIDNWELWT